MDIDHFAKHLKLANFNGVTFHMEERMSLDLALAQLKSDTAFSDILFWGKVNGTVKDYYVALALDFANLDEGFPRKKFFWCSSSNFSFSALPEVISKHVSKFEQMNTYFTGEYDRTLIEGVGPATVIDEDMGLILPPKSVTELDRLSYVVHTIERSCQACPKGAFKLTPLHSVQRNEAFKGLSAEEAFEVKNWFHLRKLEHKDKVEQMQRNESVYNNEFLDCVDKDLPAKAWSVLKDTTGTLATLRNSLWPGYYAFHKVRTNVYGSLYFGDGIRSNDLPFML